MSRMLVNAATYNELDNLPKLLEGIWRHCPDCDVLIVDDNSPDGTGAWCHDKSASEPRLHCLHRSGKLGLGSATIAAFQYAIERNYDWLVTMDADLSHPPRFIPGLRSACTDGTDLVIGSRYVAGGQIRNWPVYRRLSSRFINSYARWMLGLTPRDCSGAFRCYRVASLRQIDFADFSSSGYSFYEESLWHLAQAGLRMKEVPIEFVDRVHGQSKIGVKDAVSAVLRIAKVGIRGRFQRS